MGRAKSKLKKGGLRKKNPVGNQNELSGMTSSSWVDHLDFLPLSGSSETEYKEEGVSISIISFNVLADGYNSPKSQPGLPQEYRKVVFDRIRRGSLIRQILISGGKPTNNASVHSNSPQHLPDIWTLQEVDMDEILAKHLSSIGYEGVETPRMKIGCGSGGRVDSCGVYYRKDRWKLLDQELIRLDDLATLPAKSDDDGEMDGNAIDCVNNNLQGLQRGFLRRNNALLIRLQSKESPEATVVIAATHLYWNPDYAYVKLCQMHYIMVRAAKFMKEKEAFILCGDLNSLPGSSVHTYLTKGIVDAKVAAPWYRECSPGNDEDNVGYGEMVNGVTEKISSLNLTNGNKRYEQSQQQQVRYLLDYNLNRLCRWFRILGLDAGLESEEEERLRTKEGKMVLFDRCRAEHRVLITTSNKLLVRKDCPAGTYLINPRSLASNLEIAFVHILLTHGVVLEPHKFLSRCVVCNGDICTVHDTDLKKKIFTEYQAPIDLDEVLEVYQCNGCKQGYWWCDRPTSSASRVKVQATRLYQICLRAGIPILPPKEEHMFEHVNVEEERQQGWDWSTDGSELLKLRLQVTEWLKDPELRCPIQQLQSAYKDDSNDTGESLPFTNVTDNFKGTLDYIFFGKQNFVQTKRLYVPTTYDELNTKGIYNGHLLPSDVWPSDHLAIGATLHIRPKDKKKTSVVKKPLPPPGPMVCAPTAVASPPSAVPPQLMQLMGVQPSQAQQQQHSQRCDCGCVPNILSLFEMAELRKKKREQQKGG